MRFRYLKQPSTDPHKKWITRPFISVEVIGSKDKWKGYALIDSGADHCIFDNEIGEMIGLDITKGEPTQLLGIRGEPKLAYSHKIKIKVGDLDKTFETKARFIEKAGIVAILGQKGFFDNFRVKFERDRGVIEIIPSKK